MSLVYVEMWGVGILVSVVEGLGFWSLGSFRSKVLLVHGSGIWGLGLRGRDRGFNFAFCGRHRKKKVSCRSRKLVEGSSP